MPSRTSSRKQAERRSGRCGRLFGEDYVDAQGAMDRAKMRTLAFRDPGARKKLEQLLHPMIRAESDRRIAAASGAYVIHVVPLLVESRDYRQRVSRVLVVDCPEDLQVERVRQRSGLADEEIRRILRSQVSQGGPARRGRRRHRQFGLA